MGSSNHGVRIKVGGLGLVEVGWSDFRSVRFSENPPVDEMKRYRDFGTPKSLYGRLRTNDGQTLRGKLIYDLDEQQDTEILEGWQDGLHYYIPLRHIRQLERRNHLYTAITLTGGKKLLLTGHNDVTDKNWGVLIWDGKEKPSYVRWSKITEISLN